MGNWEKALPQEDHVRKAFSELSEASKGAHCMMGDGGFVKLPEVRCVRQESGGFCSSRGAFVGDGEKVPFEVVDAELDVGCGLRNGSHTHMLEESYEVGCASRSSCIVGYCHETSISAEDNSQRGQGLSKAECSSSIALAQLPCQVGYGENVYATASDDAYKEGNTSNGVVSWCEANDFASPRLSFSCDFAMVDISTGAPNSAHDNGMQFPRLSPEKRKWDQQDNDSSDFEFSRNGPGVEGISNPAKGGCMLSAGELFHNAVKVPSCKMDNGRPSYSRHLSFELSRPDFAACTAPGVHLSLKSPPATSATSSPSHSSSFPQAKYSLRLKEMFKPRSNLHADRSPHSELTRDDSFTSTCRFPISPRSFWPFLRNGLVCERRTDISSLACGDILDRIASSSSKGSDSSEDASKLRSISLPVQGHAEAIDKNDSGSCSPTTTVSVLKAEHSTKSDYGSLTNMCKERGRVTKSFARGSPGRRGGSNANKVLLRNLERCSAERELGRDGWRGLNKRNPYSATAFRVSPVLNVGVYKNGFFGFTSLFTSRKNKKPLEAPINWRKGA
ncbi:hypothetical protein GOP47_0030041 [Adiantum capillus-veneris]|nr:hypothetical protein GOP47_0030041 [Adiantum capillus-veneris]